MVSRTRTPFLLALGLRSFTHASAEPVPPACRAELAVPAQCATQGPAGTPFLPGANCRTVSVDGFPRQYIVYVPANVTAEPPVIMMHHGSSGDGLKFLNISGWTEKADEVGAVAVFPTSLPVFALDEQRCTTRWNGYGFESEIDLTVKPFIEQAGGVILAYPEGAPWPADDVAFERAMLADLDAGLHAAPDRLYVSGFSNGAGFAARLAVDMADVFAAAAWSGSALGDPGFPPVPLRDIPRLMQLGTCDAKVAVHLGIVFDQDDCARGLVAGIPLDPAELFALPPFAATIEYHLDTFGLPVLPAEVVRRASSTSMTWRSTDPGAVTNVFQFGLLAGVTHQYPTCNANRCNNPRRFSAADYFWEFFVSPR